MDLPHTLVGFLQVEETDFRRATDTQVYAKLGSNINYLKDQSDLTNIAGASAFANTYNATKLTENVVCDGSGNFSGVIFSTPNGSPILFAIIGIHDGTININNIYPLMVLPGIGVVESLMSTPAGFIPFLPYALAQAQIQGPNNNLLYIAETNIGSYVAPNETLNVYAAIVYPSVYP